MSGCKLKGDVYLPVMKRFEKYEILFFGQFEH